MRIKYSTIPNTLLKDTGGRKQYYISSGVCRQVLVQTFLDIRMIEDRHR